MDRPSFRQHSFPPLLQSGARHRFRVDFGANEPACRNEIRPANSSVSGNRHHDFDRGRVKLPNRSKPAAGPRLNPEEFVSEVAAYMDRPLSRQHPFSPLLQSGVRHHFRFNIGANELVGRSIFGPQIRAFQETGTIVCPRKIKSSNLAKPRCRAASEIRRPRQRVAAYMDRRSSRQHPILRRLQ